MTVSKRALLYRGASRLDGTTRIVALASGLARPSANAKTGPMVQVWILRDDVAPHVAITEGLDPAVCGECPLRSTTSGGNGACYVETAKGPNGVWKAYKSGDFIDATTPSARRAIGRRRQIRLGAYGDPGAVPTAVWSQLVADASAFTGYTHQWRRRPSLRAFCMASVETPAEREEAKRRGFRTFRVHKHDEAQPSVRGEAQCPANPDRGLTCSTCPIRCDGGSGLDIRIAAHGSRKGRI